MKKFLILFFLLCATISGLLGFSFMIGADALIAKSVCGVFVGLFLVSLLYDSKRRHSEI